MSGAMGGAMGNGPSDEKKMEKVVTDAMNKVIDRTEKWLDEERRNAAGAKKKTTKASMTEALDAIKASPLVDLNWLLALA